MIKALIRKLVEKAEKWCTLTDRWTYITGTAGNDDVYMVRYFLLRTKLLTVYIHRFLRSDRDDPHDHPWDFVSYCVSGGYTEVRWTYNPDLSRFEQSVNYRNEGSLAYRGAADIHMVKLDKELKYEQRFEAPLTVIFIGPRFRPWGFWKNITTNPEWVIWHKYLKDEKEGNRENSL